MPHKQPPAKPGGPPSERPPDRAPENPLFALLSEIKAEQKWQAARLDWATLLHRVYNIDALKCPCGGRLKFVALVEDRNEAQAELLARGRCADLHLPKSNPKDACHDHVDDEHVDDWDQRPEAPDINPNAASRVWEDP